MHDFKSIFFLDCVAGYFIIFTFIAVYGSCCPDGFTSTHAKPDHHKPSASSSCARSRRTLPKNPTTSSKSYPTTTTTTHRRQIPKIKINDNDQEESKI